MGRQRRRYKFLFWLVAVISGVIFVQTLLDGAGWQRRRQLQQDVERLHAENDSRRTQAQRLRDHVDALQTRHDVQERAIREELGFVRPGEVVLKLPDATGND